MQNGLRILIAINFDAEKSHPAASRSSQIWGILTNSSSKH
jgi:hypothetical protein